MTRDDTARDGLVDRLVSSAKAFRDNPVYDSEGDGCYLVTQAEELEEAAAYIETLKAQHAEDVKRSGELEGVLTALIEHTAECERRLDEELHHVHHSGESLPLTDARAALQSPDGKDASHDRQ